jgi:hypothetical protein
MLPMYRLTFFKIEFFQTHLTCGLEKITYSWNGNQIFIAYNTHIILSFENSKKTKNLVLGKFFLVILGTGLGS